MITAWVYFVEHGNLIKIGTSTNVAERLKAVPGRLLAVEVGDRRREKELHCQFAELREYGEWFRATEALTEYIASLSPEPALAISAIAPTKRMWQPTTDAEAAFSRLLARQSRIAEIDARIAAIKAQRARDVTEALAGGMSLREIAGRLGMSPERIRQMGLVKATPKEPK